MNLLKSKTTINIILSMFIKVLAALLGFITSIILARALGPEDLGVYQLSITILTTCVIVAKLGLDNGLLKFVSLYFSEVDWSKIKGLQTKSFLLTITSSLLITMLIYLSSEYIANIIFRQPLLASPLKVVSIAIFPLSSLHLHAEMLKGIDKIKTGMFLQSALITFINIIVIVFLFVFMKTNLKTMVISYSISIIIAYIFGLLVWKVNLPFGYKNITAEFETKVLLETSLPLMWVASLNLILSYMDIYMIGIFRSTEEVGLYSIAAKIVLMSSMILVAFNGVISPKFSIYSSNGNHKKLELLAQKSTLILSGISLIVYIFLVVFNKNILGLFGSEFIKSSNIFLLLATGQFFVLATGPVGALLMMSGYGEFHKRSMILSALINLTLNLVLIPTIGSIGAAIATVISLVVKNILAVIYVKRILNINVYSNWRIIWKEF